MVPDTVTGEFSDMPHVLSFLGRKYSEVFDILMMDDKIASLMAPFKSAYENKANDQLKAWWALARQRRKACVAGSLLGVHR